MIGLIFKVTKSQSYHLNHAGVDLNQHDPFIIRSSEVIGKRLDNFELKCECTQYTASKVFSHQPMPLKLSSAISSPSIFLHKTLNFSPNSHSRSASHSLSPRSRSSTMCLAHPPAVRPVTIPFSDIRVFPLFFLLNHLLFLSVCLFD